MRDRAVGVDVELLLGLALDVGFAGGTDDVHESGAADFGLDHFRGKGHAGEQRGKAAARGREGVFLLLEDVLLNCDKHALRQRIAQKRKGCGAHHQGESGTVSRRTPFCASPQDSAEAEPVVGVIRP